MNVLVIAERVPLRNLTTELKRLGLNLGASLYRENNIFVKMLWKCHLTKVGTPKCVHAHKGVQRGRRPNLDDESYKYFSSELVTIKSNWKACIKEKLYVSILSVTGSFQVKMRLPQTPRCWTPLWKRDEEKGSFWKNLNLKK